MTKADDDFDGWSGKSVHPVQPVVMTDTGTVRFQRNPMVRKLLDESTSRGYGMNELVAHSHDIENGRDHMQHFAQLIGYSVSGYGELSYHNRGICSRADRKAEKLIQAQHAKEAAAENEQVKSNLLPWEDEK